MTEVVLNTRQKVKVVFLKKEVSIMITIIDPSYEKSHVYDFAQKGWGLHHLCFKCDNMYIDIETMKSMGRRVIATPQLGEAFDNEKIALIFAKQ